MSKSNVIYLQLNSRQTILYFQKYFCFVNISLLMFYATRPATFQLSSGLVLFFLTSAMGSYGFACGVYPDRNDMMSECVSSLRNNCCRALYPP